MNKLATTGWLLGALLWGACGSDDVKREPCVERTVFARSPTGDCTAYASSCDIPAGYRECCGGFLGGCVASGEDARCVDDPTDSCTPGAGGADCPGVCE
ncbi:hypothetical protein [Myxococcus sp. AS-1-15]|uniref:hypothetical protein n=1 Tax=Myxococcus sp. AS-1-15 TaxID=2874600 RepID=UPI001CBAC8EB|nr:hypothetical protein [Myxococcus sp. AS-1-15]MBZ4401247.1 hypothetical protein [Myxococcus sp. AS-1-15]BDT35669.1 hypothetical protein MFMH1_53380 [Myxococcus sp. MH1]